ncbi:hypothetical protein C493_10408 [Natronolimnohabitans innermongolicus JCM 12255]|uniref:Uncharacterized protein n=1 Tax=Natronolimnohabitans innermongolicus JCM 12255 TaxID=1227499 RepID=L9X5L6_9EURY|nr:hypothetical protein C493_10408 [Natronolimnohabitans innermongolicus JCM 12255]
MTVPAIGGPERPILLFNLALVLGALGGVWSLFARLRRAL